ncbi:MAG: hypothetical protein ACTSU4_14930 [Promethearchaeota archaeon]
MIVEKRKTLTLRVQLNLPVKEAWKPLLTLFFFLENWKMILIFKFYILREKYYQIQ